MVYIIKVFGFMKPGANAPCYTFDDFFPNRVQAVQAARLETEGTAKVAGVRPPHHVPRGRGVHIGPGGNSRKWGNSRKLCGSGWMGYHCPWGYIPQEWYRVDSSHWRQDRWENLRERWGRHAWRRNRVMRFPHKYRLAA